MTPWPGSGPSRSSETSSPSTAAEKTHHSNAPSPRRLPSQPKTLAPSSRGAAPPEASVRRNHGVVPVRGLR
jgi:hypothetical protein